MAEGIVYLDVDDEITSAAQRIRSAAGTRVALVVPYGSRIATSRMNFRLLSREAVMNNRRLSIVSGDAAARSLAASAGLPVFGTVPEYESSLAAGVADSGAGEPPRAAGAGLAASETVVAAAGDQADQTGTPATTTAEAAPADATPTDATPRAAAGRKSQRPKRPVPDETTTVATPLPAAAAPSAADRWSPVDRWARADRGAEDERDDAPSAGLPALLGGRIRAPVIAALGLVVLALIVAGVGAYVFLPSASITLVPRRDPIGPIELTVSADPQATAVDAVNGVVPAVEVPVPVEASRTFITTGVHVEEAAAKGSVTFTNYDTSSGVSIPNGSIVSTEGGVRFRTQKAVALQPAAVFPAFQPTSDSVAVVAAKTGEAGNVPENTIRVVPQGKDPVLLRVNNPDPTAGGVHTETPEITQPEVDKAIAALQAELDQAFSDAVAAGAGAPADTTVFPATKALPAATPDIDPQSLVGQAVATFNLKLSATGTVIAVDPRPVRAIAETQLASQVAANHRLVDGSADVVVGEGTVGEDGQVTFQATARAEQVTIVDPAALRALVKGKTAAAAKAALAPFGAATVTLWPDWATTVTGIDARLAVTVDADAGDGSGSSPAPPSGSGRPAGSGATGSASLSQAPGAGGGSSAAPAASAAP